MIFLVVLLVLLGLAVGQYEPEPGFTAGLLPAPAPYAFPSGPAPQAFIPPFLQASARTGAEVPGAPMATEWTCKDGECGDGVCLILPGQQRGTCSCPTPQDALLPRCAGKRLATHGFSASAPASVPGAFLLDAPSGVFVGFVGSKFSIKPIAHSRGLAITFDHISMPNGVTVKVYEGGEGQGPVIAVLASRSNGMKRTVWVKAPQALVVVTGLKGLTFNKKDPLFRARFHTN